MRDRMTTLAGAILALLVVYALFFGSPAPERPVTRPTTAERGGNGYYALYHWLAGEQVPTMSLRDRFTTLGATGRLPGDTGNILVTTLPYATPIRDAELGAVLDWVESGNTLLALAALNDTPDWSRMAGSNLIDDLEALSDLRFTSVGDQPGAQDPDDATISPDAGEALILFDDAGGEQEYAIVPTAGHPLMQGVSDIRAVSDFASAAWTPEPIDYELLLEVAVLQSTRTAAIWQKKIGDGQILLAASGSFLTNRALARGDNRRFVANLVRIHLGDGGTVIFDDLHQGLSTIYDPEAFFADERLHNTLYVLIALWFLYVIGSSNRLVSPRPGAAPIRQSDFVEAVGGFVCRHTSRATVGLQIYRAWFNELRRQMGLPTNGEPVWNEIEHLATVDKRLAGELRRQYRLLESNRNVDLVTVHNTIYEAKRAFGS